MLQTDDYIMYSPKLPGGSSRSEPGGVGVGVGSRGSRPLLSPSGPMESLSESLGQQLRHSPMLLRRKSRQADSVIMSLLCKQVSSSLKGQVREFLN